MKGAIRLLLSLFCFSESAFLPAQTIDVQAFGEMPPQRRLQYVHNLPFERFDTLGLSNALASMLEAAREKNDAHSVFALSYHRFIERGKLLLSQTEILDLLSGMETLAGKAGLEVEKTVAQHYLNFEHYYAGKIPHEKMYVRILQTFATLERLGFENFSDYHPEAILNHLGEFMLDLNDHEKALQFLLAAKRFIRPTLAGSYHYVLTLNRLQTCFQQKKDYESAMGYAREIIRFNAELVVEVPHERWRTRFWQGLASLDIASMLVETGRLAEAEQYAIQGYEMSRAGDFARTLPAFYAEFDALQVLLSIRLKTGRIESSGELLHRGEAFRRRFEADPYGNTFRFLKFYKNCARYYELKREFSTANRYAHLAQDLQDSLDRRNDVRKFEQLQRRLDAEKYREQIRIIENEKQLQKNLRDALLVILLMAVALGWVNFTRIRAKRRLALAELQVLGSQLASLTEGFQEKSALVERMRQEVEKLDTHGERSKLLEELTHSAILTNDDWQRFRSIFEKVHPGFMAELALRYPGITSAELRLLVFEKLGLNDFETANLLGISRASVQQTRWRMRKKLEETVR